MVAEFYEMWFHANQTSSLIRSLTGAIQRQINFALMPRFCCHATKELIFTVSLSYNQWKKSTASYYDMEYGEKSKQVKVKRCEFAK